ncbi:hypothetical protein GUJ93_ZPchr0014g47132 [Zizania palustris]|uniref:Uncharacterized protein n=1 Tax=Zizania palustris TaxID=103762 RepID=A0A8J5VS35_ZIZPA|nr:hypothetical protein GUJ93_ZPchr0014g47132 [Zizania palustris]KAG8082459.1 hypothetical protein GUJ93_ZPchr0014g47132 [Zizania palustris]KAG8082460.1 hypothetical protein GUJ93_ZPchr0014g47132 [Zizania palustris]
MLFGKLKPEFGPMEQSYKRVTYSYADLDSACIMPVRITIPTEMISAIREVDSLLYFSGIGDEPERDSRNSDFACFTPLKDVLPPEMVAEVNDPSDKSRRGKNPQRELNRDDNGDSSCYIPLPESQVGQNIAENVIPNVNANCHTVEEPEDGLLQGINTDPTVQFPCNDMEEHEPFELPTLRCKTKLINEMSPSTSEPMTEAATGVLCSPKFMVTTPAKNEKHQVTRKRRRVYNKDYIPRDRGDKRQVRRRGAPALYDENIVLPNEILRKAIEDTSDLVLRRGKAPHTCLDTWKEARLGSLPATFMDPLILYSTSVYLKYTVTTDAPKSSCGESVKTRRHLSFDLSETNNICNDAKNVEGESIPEPRKRKLDELTNGIQVPVGLCIESGQFQDDDCRFNVDTAIEKGLPLSINGHGSHSAGLLERLHESKSNGLKRHESLSAAIDNLDEVIPMDEGHARDECTPLHLVLVFAYSALDVCSCQALLMLLFCRFAEFNKNKDCSKVLPSTTRGPQVPAREQLCTPWSSTPREEERNFSKILL